MGAEPDRSPGGRAGDRRRNDRPRDALGRPLPHGTPGVDRVPDDLVLPAAEALAEAQRLLDDGLPFHAHEVLEATWKASPADERDLWQGLAQLAVGLTHLARGNRRGAAALLLRGRDRIAGYRTAPPHGIDVTALTDWATATAEQVRTAPAEVPTAQAQATARIPPLRTRPPGT